jgi:hypothetical protein
MADGQAAGEGDERSGIPAVVAALDVPRHARRGFAVGVLVAIGLFVLFVVVPGASRSPALYVALAVVLAMAVGLLMTATLVAATAYRLAGDLSVDER